MNAPHLPRALAPKALRPLRFEQVVIVGKYQAPGARNAVEEIDADYDATPLDIGFNARYLLDITGQLDSDTALFKLADPGSPTIIQDREESATLYVLMPMRV